MTGNYFRPLHIGSVFAVGMALAACASTPHHHAPKVQMVTYITATGQKQFSFTETLQHSGGSGQHGHGHGGGMGGMGHMGHMGGGFGGGRSRGSDAGDGAGVNTGDADGGYAQEHDARAARMLKQRLDAQLAATGYCRNGYKELSSQFQRGQNQINGQCTEPATAQDLTRFPNS